MASRLVDIYRGSHPGTTLTDDQITMRYAQENAATLKEVFEQDPAFEADYRRISANQMGGSAITSDPKSTDLNVDVWNRPPPTPATQEYTGGLAAGGGGEVTGWDATKNIYKEFMGGFMAQNVATTLPESIGLGTAALNWSTGLPDTSRLPGETDEEFEKRYDEVKFGWGMGPTPHDPYQTTSGSFAKWMKEDVFEALTPDIEDHVKKELRGHFGYSELPAALGSGAGFLLGGGIIGKILQKGIRKAAGKTFDKVLKETGEAALAKGATLEAARLTGLKAAREAHDTFLKKAITRSSYKTTAALGALASGPAGYQDAIAKGATPNEAFASWLLNAGLGVSEIIPIGKMLARLSGTGAAKGLKQVLVDAGIEGMEEALQEWLQGRGGDAIAAWIVAYDPDRNMLKGWARDAELGGASGVILSLLSSIVGGKVRQRRQVESGIDPEAVKDIEANITAGKPLNESEQARAREAGYFIEDGVAKIPSSPAEVARVAYSGGKSGEIVALAQREATEGFTPEIEEEYNKLLGVTGTEDKYAKQLYDQTKFQIQTVVEAEKAEAEIDGLVESIVAKLEAGGVLSEEETSLLQAEAEKKGGPLSAAEKLDALRTAAHGGYMGEDAQREEQGRRKEEETEDVKSIPEYDLTGVTESKKEEDDDARLEATEEGIKKQEVQASANEKKRRKAATAATEVEAVKPEVKKIYQGTDGGVVQVKDSDGNVVGLAYVDPKTKEVVDNDPEMQGAIWEGDDYLKQVAPGKKLVADLIHPETTEAPVEEAEEGLSLNQKQWYVSSVDDGVVAGPFKTKREADLHRPDMGTPLKKEGDLYESGRYIVGKGSDLEVAGLNKAPVEGVLPSAETLEAVAQVEPPVAPASQETDAPVVVGAEEVSGIWSKRLAEEEERLAAEKAKPKGKAIDPTKVVVGESNAADSFDAGQERNVKAAEKKAKKGKIPAGQVIRDSKITREGGSLQHTDVAIDPNAKAGTETGGPGFYVPGDNTNEGQELQSRIDAYALLSQGDENGNADGIISMEDDSTPGVGWRVNGENIEIWADGVAMLGEGATVPEAITAAKKGAAERIGRKLTQGSHSPVGGTSTRRIVALTAPDGKVVTLGVHETQGGVATVPNITTKKGKSMPLSELIDKHGYKVAAVIRTNADHVLFKETFENNEAFDLGISDRVKGLQAIQPASGIDKGAKPSDTPTNIDPETNQPKEKKRDAPRRYPRPSDKKINVAFSNIADAARTAGVSVKIVQGEFADVEKKAAAYMTLEDGRVVATLAMESVNNPTNSNTLDLIHEINHVVFDQLDPEIQAALDNAFIKVSDKAIGTDHVSAFLFDSSMVDQVPSELRQEEKLVEAVANEMVEDGFDPATSTGLVKTLVRIWKNISFAAKMAWQRMIHGADALSPSMAKEYFRLQSEAFLTGNTVPRFLNYLVQKPTLMEAAAMFGDDVSRVFMSSKNLVVVEPVVPDTISGLRFNMKYAGIRRYSPEEGKVDDSINVPQAKRDAASNNAVLQALRNVFAAFTMSGANRNTEGGVLVDEDGFLRKIMGRRTKPTRMVKEIEGAAGPEVASTTLEELDDIEDKPRAAMNADKMLSGIVKGLKRVYGEAMDLLNPSNEKGVSHKRAKLYSELEDLRKNYNNIAFVINKLQESLTSAVHAFKTNKTTKGLFEQTMLEIDEDLVGKFKAVDWDKQPTPDEMDDFGEMVLVGVDFSQSVAKVLNQIQHLVPVHSPQNDREKLLLAKFITMAQVNPVAVELLLHRGTHSDYKSKFDIVIRIAIKADKNSVDRALDKYTEEFPETERDKFKSGEFAKFNIKARKMLDKIRMHKEKYRGLDEEIQQAKADIALYETTRAALDEQRAYIESLYDKEKSFEGIQWEPTDKAKYMVPTDPNQDIVDVRESTQTLDLSKKLDIKRIFDHVERMTLWLGNQPENMRGEVWRTMLRQRDKLLALPVDQMQRSVSSSWIMRLAGDYVTKLETVGNARSRKLIHQFKVLSRYINTYGGERSSKIGREWAKNLDDLKAVFRANGSNSNRKDIIEDEYSQAFHFFDENRDVLSQNPGEKGERMLLNKLKAHMKQNEEYNPGFVDAIWPTFEKFILTTRKASRHVNEMRKEMGLAVKDEFGDYTFFRDTVGDSLTTTMRKPATAAVDVFKLLRDHGWEHTKELWGTPKIREAYNQDPEAFKDYVQDRFYVEGQAIMEDFIGPLANKTGVGILTGRAVNGFKRPVPQSLLREAYELNPNDFMAMLETLAAKEGLTVKEDKAVFIADAIQTFQGVYRTIRGTQREGDVKGHTAMPPHIMMDARHTTNWPAVWVEYATFGQRNVYQYAKHLATEAAFGRDLALLNSDVDGLKSQLEGEISDHKKIEKGLRKQGLSTKGRYLTGKFRRAYNKKAKAMGFNPNELRKAEQKLKTLGSMERQIGLWLKAESSTPLEYMVWNDFIRTLAGFTVQAYGTALIDTISIVEQPFRKMGLGQEAFKTVGRNVGNAVGIGTGSAFQMFHKTVGFQAEKMQMLQELGLDDMTATLEGNFFSRIWNNWRALQSDEFVTEPASPFHPWDTISRGAEHLSRIGRAVLASGGGKAEAGKPGFPAFRPLTIFTQLAKQSAMANTMSTWSQFTTLIAKTSKLIEENPQYKEILMNEGVLFDEDVLKKYGVSIKEVIQELGYGKSFLVFNDTRAFLYMQDQMQKGGFNLERVALDYIKRRAKDPKADPIGNKDLYRTLANMTLTEIMLETDLITRPTWMTSNAVGQFVTPLLGWSVSKTNDVRKELNEPGGKKSLRGMRWGFLSHLAIMPVWAWYGWFRDEFDEEIVGKKSDIQRGEGFPSASFPLLPGYPSVEEWKEDAGDAGQILLERMDRVGALGFAGEAAVAGLGAAEGNRREFSVDSRVFGINTISSFIESFVRLGRQSGTATWETFGKPFTQSLGGSGFLQTAQIVNNFSEKMLGEGKVPFPTSHWSNHRIGVLNYIRAAGRELNLDVKKRRAMQGSPSRVKAHVGEMVLASYAGNDTWWSSAREEAKAAIAEELEVSRGSHEIATRLVAAFEAFHPIKAPFQSQPTTEDYDRILEVIEKDGSEDARKGVEKAVENFNRALVLLGEEAFMGKVIKKPKPPPRFRTRPPSISPSRPRPGFSSPPGDYRSRAATMNP